MTVWVTAITGTEFPLITEIRLLSIAVQENSRNLIADLNLNIGNVNWKA